MAGKRKSKKSTKKRAAAASAAPADASTSNINCADAQAAFEVSLHNMAPAFWTAVAGLQCPAELDVEDESADAPPPAQCSATIEASLLPEFLLWFAKGAGGERTAKATFSSGLTKEDRAAVHRLVEDRFSAALTTVSEGVGDVRSLTVYLKGQAPKKTLSPEALDQANQLYRWAKEAGLAVSRDELVEALSSNALPQHLQSLWEAKSASAQATGALAAAVAAGDVTSVQSLLAAQPQLVKLPAGDFPNSELPLHTAARTGQAGVMQVLVAAGFNANATSGSGKTALQVSRTFEQCDAEAVLLQLGAHDPEAQHFPLSTAAAELDAAPTPSPTEHPAPAAALDPTESLCNPSPSPAASAPEAPADAQEPEAEPDLEAEAAEPTLAARHMAGEPDTPAAETAAETAAASAVPETAESAEPAASTAQEGVLEEVAAPPPHAAEQHVVAQPGYGIAGARSLPTTAVGVLADGSKPQVATHHVVEQASAQPATTGANASTSSVPDAPAATAAPASMPAPAAAAATYTKHSATPTAQNNHASSALREALDGLDSAMKGLTQTLQQNKSTALAVAAAATAAVVGIAVVVGVRRR